MRVEFFRYAALACMKSPIHLPRPVRHFFLRLVVRVIRVMHWHARLLSRIAASLILLAVLLWLGLTFWIFPSIDNYRHDFADLASRAVGVKLSVGSIKAHWEDLEPTFELGDVTLHDRQRNPALHLDQVRLSLSWLSLLVFETRFARIGLAAPELVLRRDRGGVVYLADLPLNQGGDGRFGNWVLRQHRISVDRGRLVWVDEREGIPALQIDNVNLRIDNVFRNHRFDLVGTPPPALASIFKLSGTLRGRDLNRLADWSGDIRVDLGYADVAAWRSWLPLPQQLLRGKGGVATWFAFEGPRLKQGVLELDVSNAALQFAADLPQLQVTHLRGQAELRSKDNGNVLNLNNVELQLQSGAVLKQNSLSLERSVDRSGQVGMLAMASDRLDLATWLALAPHLPIPAELHRYLSGMAPAGQLQQFRLEWLRPDSDAGSFNLASNFSELNLLPVGSIPGVRNLRGNITMGSQGGALSLDCSNCTVLLPRVFVEPLALRSLNARLGWQRRGNDWQIDLNSVRIDSADARANLNGRYTSSAGGAGVADLHAELLQGRADAVWRYIPLSVGENTREWLRTSLKAGIADRALMVLRGPLDDFPWDKRKTGQFRVDVEARDVDLEYADKWPRIARIGASLLFQGDRLQINARQGNISGNRLMHTSAVIPSLAAGDKLLIDGEVVGPLANFLRFVDNSPVNGMLDGFTQGTNASGDAQLRLKLDIPLANTDATRVAGQLLLQNNQLLLGKGIPPLDQARGSLYFSERGVRFNNISARALGGGVNLTADTARDGTITINAAGNAGVAALAQVYADPLWRFARGETRYQLGIAVRKGLADWWLESGLQGVQIDLPAPLRKVASESRPLRLQVRNISDEQQRLQVRYDQAMLADLQFQQRKLQRGQVSFNPSADIAGRPGQPIASVLPQRNALAIGGSLPYLNLDLWQPVLGALGSSGNSDLVRSINDLRIGLLEGFGKQLHEVRLLAASDAAGWSGAILARELGGNFIYADQDKPRLQARLKKLSLPLPDSALEAPASTRQQSVYPALDVEIENLQYKERSLGKLELRAAPSGEVWQIDRLATLAADGRLELEGVWNYRARVPQSKMTVRLDSDDLGKFLARFGFSDTVRRGGAKLTGQLAWNGSPHQPDVASMSGSFDLEAKSGQFAKVEPGMGRLLAIVSLQALPRRITLDFRDVFSEGFAFDSLAGHFEMNRGVLRTDSFNIVGPAAVIGMKGDIDLPNQSQVLNVKVVPVIGDSVSIAAGFVINPMVGLTALVLQKLLKDPLGQLMAYEYQISGSWSDPKVERLGSALVNAARRAQQANDAGRQSPGPHGN